MELTIGIGDFKISNKENAVLKTYALSSCIAVTAYSPSKKVAGMVHIALPTPTDESEAQERPAYYASTGIPMMINKMCQEFGCHKHELQIHLYGGAESVRKDDVFQIGKRNFEAVKQALKGLNVNVHKTEVGGKHSRTLVMDVAAGKVKVHYHPISI